MGHEFAAENRRHQRSEEHTSELQSPCNLVCRLLLEKKKKITKNIVPHTTIPDKIEQQLLLQQTQLVADILLQVVFCRSSTVSEELYCRLVCSQKSI